MKSHWRVYIKPFDDSGNYLEYQDVTDDVLEIGSINSDLDNTDYDIGVYRFSNFKITLRNDHARYSDVGSDETMFRYKRSDSLVKITWEIADEGPFVGVASSESGQLSEETTIFIGLLNDESLAMDLTKQVVSFTCIGREYLFGRTTVPFGSISAGDLFSTVIFALLDQTNITAQLTVDADNITCGTDLEIDSISSLQNKTVQEGLNKLLLASNSVLYVRDDTVYVSPRTPSADVVLELFGQTSQNGAENILDIKNIKNGLNKVFNYFTWKDTALFSQDVTSIAKYGVRKKELDFEFVTDNTKRQTILDNLKNEFANPKQEFDLFTPMTYKSLVCNLLDKVSIDYPIVYVSTGEPVPICGVAICGENFLPKALSAFVIGTSDFYKTISRSINPNNSTIRFKMRLI